MLHIIVYSTRCASEQTEECTAWFFTTYRKWSKWISGVNSARMITIDKSCHANIRRHGRRWRSLLEFSSVITMEHCTLMSQARGRNYARDIAILACAARPRVGENRVISQSGLAIRYGPLITPGRFGSGHSLIVLHAEIWSRRAFQLFEILIK